MMHEPKIFNLAHYFLIVLLALSDTLVAQNAAIEILPDQPYDKYELKTDTDTNTFYLSAASSKEQLPLVVYIQGSGMNSLFSKTQDGRIRSDYGHGIWFDVGQEKCRVLIVEKPGLTYLHTGESKSFDEKFSLDSFSAAIINALNYVLQHESIDKRRICVAGHSEGGIVAAKVANLLREKVSHVAILAGEGPSQLYSLYKFAQDGTFFNEKEHQMPTAEQRIKYLSDQWRAILKEPKSTDKKFWGFTYLRWSSMLRTSVIDELTGFNGKILLIQGTADKAVHPESATIAFTTLLSKGKSVELQLVENADHSFNILDKPETDGWKTAIERTMEWFKK